MKFVKFTENNDNEGESWNFWLQLEGNEAQLKQLGVWLNTFDDDGEEYELDMNPVDEAEVNVLVKHTDQGYMDYQNKVIGKLTLPEVKDDATYEWLNDNFYKGGIRGLFK